MKFSQVWRINHGRHDLVREPKKHVRFIFSSIPVFIPAGDVYNDCMSSREIINSLYQTLVQQVALELSQGLAAAQKALEYARLRTYWQIGRRISEAARQSRGAIVPGDKLYARISADLHAMAQLDLAPDTIRRTIQFYKNYPEFPEDSPLTFTHYLTLMRVSDARIRRRLEREACRKNLTVAQMEDRVGAMSVADPVGQQSTTTARLICERGEPYIYMTLSRKDFKGARHTYVDAGFKIHVPLDSGVIRQAPPSLSGPQSRYVRAVKDGRVFDLHLAPRKWQKIHTYAAVVIRVIDGDTLDVMADAGFSMRTPQRIRLKGIDAPEITIPAGRKARAFLIDYLTQCPLIVIRTQKAGIYGRWIADVFALSGCDDPRQIAREGEFLNQRLLDEGLAKVYKSA